MIETLSGETLLYPILGDPIGFVKITTAPDGEVCGAGTQGHLRADAGAGWALEDVLHGLAPVPNIRGLLITMPHKSSMFPHCATVSETSRLLGVVSVARRNRDGSWHGDMLDGLAFVEAQKKAGATIKGSRILQIGAGAAGSAIAAALVDAGAGELLINDVDPAKSRALVQLLSHRGRVLAGEADPTGCDIVINTTPVGMHADDASPVAPELLRPSMFVGDVVAGHGTTLLLQAAREAGCKTADGSQMVDAGLDLMLHFFLDGQ